MHRRLPNRRAIIYYCPLLRQDAKLANRILPTVVETVVVSQTPIRDEHFNCWTRLARSGARAARGDPPTSSRLGFVRRRLARFGNRRCSNDAARVAAGVRSRSGCRGSHCGLRLVVHISLIDGFFPPNDSIARKMELSYLAGLLNLWHAHAKARATLGVICPHVFDNCQVTAAGLRESTRC
jgi:hypothetical protein